MNTLLDGKPKDPGQRPAGVTPAPTVPTSSVPSSGLNKFSLAIGIVSLLLLALIAFDLNTTKSALKKSNDQLASLEKTVESNDKRLLNLTADFGVVNERLGITQRELDAARAQAAQIQRDQQKATQEVQAQLSKKAEAAQVKQLKEETSSQIGAVSGEVSNVKSDVEKTKKDLESARRELLDVRDTLSSQIAHNSSELGDLRRRGERNYIEFELDKKQGFKKVGDISLRLTKVDQKKKKYTLVVSVDDNTLEKRDKTADEPVQFLVGKSRLRYEIVIYQVGKNTVTGYLSVPKDAKLSSENPRPGQ